MTRSPAASPSRGPGARRRGLRLVPLVLLAAALPLAELPAEPSQRIEIDRCIGGKCRKNGKYLWVSVTSEERIVYIDPHRCREFDYHCPSSYERFTAENDVPVVVDGYEPGEKTASVFKVRMPVDSQVLYVYGINGSGRHDSLDLRPYLESTGIAVAPERPAEPPAAPAEPAPAERRPEPAAAPAPRSAPVETPPALPRAAKSLDELYEAFSLGYDRLDADAVARLYTDDALYLAPGGDIVRGRAAIAAGFDRMFGEAARHGQRLEIRFVSVERSVERPLAYDVGYYELERRAADGTRSVSRGKFAVVCKWTPDGWRFHVDSYSAAPASR